MEANDVQSAAARIDQRTKQGPPHVATLIDYQNLYTYLDEKLSYPHHPADYIYELLDQLPSHLRKEYDLETAVTTAFGDFQEIGDQEHNIQESLYMQGVTAYYVPGAGPSASTGLQLTISAMEVLYHRPDVESIALMTGDRDLLPLVQHLHQYGRSVYLVAFEEDLAADLVSTSGSGDFLNARRFLTGESRRHLMAEFKSENVGFDALKALPNDIDRKALELIEEYFGQYEEIYLTPLLRKLSEELGEDELDPKEIVSDLEEVGAGRLEKRRGEPHDYTVLILNPRHPDVVEVRERMREEGSLYSPDEVSYDVADYAEDENGG